MPPRFLPELSKKPDLNNRVDPHVLALISGFLGPPAIGENDGQIYGRDVEAGEQKEAAKAALIAIEQMIIARSHSDNGNGSLLHPLTFLHLSDESMKKGAHFSLQAEWIRALILGFLGDAELRKVEAFAKVCAKAVQMSQVEIARVSVTGPHVRPLDNLHFRLDPTTSRRHFPEPMTKACEIAKAKDVPITDKQLAEYQEEVDRPRKSTGGGKNDQVAKLRQNERNAELRTAIKNRTFVAVTEIRPQTITLHYAINRLKETLEGTPGYHGKALTKAWEADVIFMNGLAKKVSNRHAAWLNEYWLVQDDWEAWQTLDALLDRFAAKKEFVIRRRAIERQRRNAGGPT